MKVFRLPFVDDFQTNETHMYALRLKPTTNGPTWHFVTEG